MLLSPLPLPHRLGQRASLREIPSASRSAAATPPPLGRPARKPPHRQHRRRGPAVHAASQQPRPPADGADSDSSNGAGAWRTFWGALDTGAWVGAAATALAFVLTQEALLVGGPIVLPLLALYASRQRQRLDAQAAQAELQRQVQAALAQFTSITEESAAQVAGQMAAEAEAARQGREQPEKGMRALGAKLSAVEGSVLSVGAATREALQEASGQQGRSAREVAAALAALRRDLGADVKQAAAQDRAALEQADARLAALQEAVASLEYAQTESSRRLGSTLTAALAESQAALAAAVREEAWNAAEQVRRLPQLLEAAALPGRERPSGLSEDTLRAVVGEEVGAAVRQLAEQQAVLLAEVGGRPGTIAPAQWNQLGSRLLALDGQLEELRREQRRSQEGVAAVLEAVARLEAARGELSQLAADVQAAFERALGGEGGAASAGEKESGMREASAAFSALCTQLSAFDVQLVALQQRLDRLPPVPGPAPAAAESAPSQAALDTSPPSEAAASDKGGPPEARRVEGRGGGGSAETSAPHAAAPLGDEGQIEGVPIRTWLSIDEDEQPSRQQQQQQQQQDTSRLPRQPQLVGGGAGSPPPAFFAAPNLRDEPIGDTLLRTAADDEREGPSGNASGNGSREPDAARAADAAVEAEAAPDAQTTDATQGQAPEPPPPTSGEAYQLGLHLLRRGRALAAPPGGDWGEADAALRQAADCFALALEGAPDDVRALGNYGNVLLAHGSLKAQMLEAVRSGAAVAGDVHVQQAVEASRQRLAAEAQDLLVLAGRRFKRVLELDPSQARAFLNWGRAVGLRAELARAKGDSRGAGALFRNAADKFAAAMELSGEGGAPTARLAGAALMCGALCEEEPDPQRAGQMMEEAEGYLAAALAANPADREARAKLAECKAWLGGP